MSISDRPDFHFFGFDLLFIFIIFKSSLFNTLVSDQMIHSTASTGNLGSHCQITMWGMLGIQAE